MPPPRLCSERLIRHCCRTDGLGSLSSNGARSRSDGAHVHNSLTSAAQLDIGGRVQLYSPTWRDQIFVRGQIVRVLFSLSSRSIALARCTMQKSCNTQGASARCKAPIISVSFVQVRKQFGKRFGNGSCRNKTFPPLMTYQRQHALSSEVQCSSMLQNAHQMSKTQQIRVADEPYPDNV
jgi:hypothetical protein